MITRALVAYGTKAGATAGIAEEIGEVLRHRGISTDVLPADRVRSVDEYGIVVVGGGMYVGRWHGDAVKFLKRFADALQDREVWLFGDGPTGGTPGAEAKLAELLAQQPPAPGNARKLAERVTTHRFRTFGGAVDPETGGFFARYIPKGDWRDHDAIRAWADLIADQVQPVAKEPLPV
jgi:menaquinone-dependent protoporphyrinogen oxidase